jgi:hypothetical protein
MILATFTPPDGIVAWLACLTFVVMLVNGVFKLVHYSRSKPSALDVQQDGAAKYQPKGDYATRGDLTNLEARINAMSAASDLSRHELRTHIDVSVAKLGDRVESLREDIGEVERRLNKSSEERAIESHKRHNELLAAVSELRGAFDQVNR